MTRVTLKETQGNDEGFGALAAYVRDYRAGGYPVTTVTESVCTDCGGRAFHVALDDEAGCAERACTACGGTALLADSADYWPEAELVECECPCGGDVFAVAVGFGSGEGDGDVQGYGRGAGFGVGAVRAGDRDDVRWVSIGLRCLRDGTVGVYTDWKIDYSPSGHLRGQA